MKKIIATEHGESDVLKTIQTEEPYITGKKEIKIRMEYCGINYTSVEKRRGNYHGVTTDWDIPYNTGIEGTGSITEIGDSIEKWSIGDRVGVIKFHGGTWRDYTTVSLSENMLSSDSFSANPETHELIFELPEDISYAEGAAIPMSFLTAYATLNLFGDMTIGDNVLIHSTAGGVGSAAVQIANQYDVTTFGLASSQEKLNFATELGLDYPINYTKKDTSSKIHDITGTNCGIDLALDSIGGREFKEIFDVINMNGNIVTFGVSSGSPGVVSTPKLLFNNVSISGFHLLATFLDDDLRQQLIPGFMNILDLIKSDKISIHINKKFSINSISEAHDYLENRNSMGSIVLDL